MRKKFNVVFIVFLLLMSTVEINATPGRLTSTSIVQCNGIFYGSHGADKHWHIAKKNDNGSWSAIGQPLSNGNPCDITPNKDQGTVPSSGAGSSSSSTETQQPLVTPQETEAEKNARIEAAQKAEEERLEKERIDEEERIKKEKEEEERLKREKEAAEKQLEEESSIKYVSIIIDEYKYNEYKFSKTKTFIVLKSIAPVVVEFQEGLAKFEYHQNESLDYYERGNIKLKLTSFNKVNTENIEISVLRLPTVAHVRESKDFGILINDEIYNYVESGFEIQDDIFKELDSKDLKFTYKGKEIPVDYRIEIMENKDQEKRFVIATKDFDKEYEFPFSVETKLSFIDITISIIVLGSLLFGFRYIFNRSKHRIKSILRH